mmetsp:Transcript_145036/g.361779  ORF Transcript_145036/g.361779 Transcript_145036/m.361779 type:complete len:210 (-) Transcript_145036:128-757(-)
MDAATETQNQILQMTQFILNEAKDKAEEISAKALQEFSVEKLKVVNSGKDKIRQEYDRKAKQIETQNAIARSTAINRSRLEKIKARQDVISQIAGDTKVGLQKELKDEAKMRDFITKLIVQGLLMLLEEKVDVRCRACDDQLVAKCLDAAAKEYTRVVEAETGAKKTCKLSLDKAVKLPPAPADGEHGASCLGGVAKPTIRHLLFTEKR